MHIRPMEGVITTVEEATDSKKGQEEGQEVEESTVDENPIKDDDQEECNADSQSTNEKTTTAEPKYWTKTRTRCIQKPVRYRDID